MAGWDSNWDSTEAKEKLPYNCLFQLWHALKERAFVMEDIPELPCAWLGLWDNATLYQQYDGVTRNLVNKGAWSDSTSYVKYDLVTHEDDKGEWARGTTYDIYQKVKVSSDGALAYSSLLTYAIGEYVTYDLIIYRCIQIATDKQPDTEPTYWEVIDSITTAYYICKGNHSGLPPASNPDEWWTYNLAPKRQFYALLPSVNKNPHAQPTYWRQHTNLDLEFCATLETDNLNKDPLTEPDYWEIATSMLRPESLPGDVWFNLFENAIDDMVPVSSSSPLHAWINHNESPTRVGGWDNAVWGALGGVTGIPPWIMSDMLEEIGDGPVTAYSAVTAYTIGQYVTFTPTPPPVEPEETYICLQNCTGKTPNTEPLYWAVATPRIAAPVGGKLLREWCVQQRKIINQLRWYGFLARDHITDPESPWRVTFDLDDKATRSGGGALVQLVDTGNAATEPTISLDPKWTNPVWNPSDFSNITDDLDVILEAEVNIIFYDYAASEGGYVNGEANLHYEEIYGDYPPAVTASPAFGYFFAGWSDYASNPRQDGPTEGVDVIALFTPDAPFTLIAEGSTNPAYDGEYYIYGSLYNGRYCWHSSGGKWIYYSGSGDIYNMADSLGGGAVYTHDGGATGTYDTGGPDVHE